MIAVVQRVLGASVETEGHKASIGHGLCILLAVETADAGPEADWMARKLANLRIFADDAGLMNRSVRDVGGGVLLVSQFTLAGDCRKGNRPSFVAAAEPAQGRALYDRVAQQLRAEHDLRVECGVFGAMMKVTLTNDGPVTLIVRK